MFLPDYAVVIHHLPAFKATLLRLLDEAVQGAASFGRHYQRSTGLRKTFPHATNQIGPGVVEKQTICAENPVEFLRVTVGSPFQHLALNRTGELVAAQRGLHVVHRDLVAVRDQNMPCPSVLRNEQSGQTRHAAAQLQHGLVPEQRQVRADVVAERLFGRPDANVACVVEAHQILGGEGAVAMAHVNETLSFALVVLDAHLVPIPGALRRLVGGAGVGWWCAACRLRRQKHEGRYATHRYLVCRTGRLAAAWTLQIETDTDFFGSVMARCGLFFLMSSGKGAII